MEHTVCQECGAHTNHSYDNYEQHSPTCSLINFEAAKAMLKQYANRFNEDAQKERSRFDTQYINFMRQINKLKLERDRWKGKFLEVKNENNKLRKHV